MAWLQVSIRGGRTGIRRAGGPALHRDIGFGGHQCRRGIYQHFGGVWVDGGRERVME